MKQSKTVLRHYYEYLQSKACTLDDVYGRYSEYKRRAFDHCVQKMLEKRGFDGRIVTFNTNVFTFGFHFIEPETGELCYYHITPTRDYQIVV